MPFNKLTLPPGHEIRVELIRLYPEQEHHAILRQLQDEVRSGTNYVIKCRKDTKDAILARAERLGLVPQRPEMLPRPSLATPETDEEKQAVKAAWDQYRVDSKASATVYAKWMDAAFKSVKDLPECSWRKHTYQQIRGFFGYLGSAVLFRDALKRVSKTKRAQFKKPTDHVPLVWGNGDVLKTGDVYGYRRGQPFYDALVTIQGMKIPGRLRRPIPGRVVQGVALTLKADGWYAAIKCIVPIRLLPEATEPAVGVDVGQIDMVALSDGYAKTNERTSEQRSLRAALQSVADLSKDPEQIVACRRKVSRIDQSAARRVKHWICADLLPRLSRHTHVFIEKLAKNFKSDHGPLSCMHMVLDAIKLRLGDRVREVPCAYTSQTCSCCGNVSKSARQGKRYICDAVGCGHVQDADLNASRNILSKGLELLAIAC